MALIMDRKLLTIIIPVYNCAQTIVRCLDSIDYADAEVIVVDDGSTDVSVDVVKEYISTHPNVRLLQKENGGVSSARNVGIEASAGKYIMFVDADDYLAPMGIERVLQMAEENEADVVKFGFRNMSNESVIDTESIKLFPCSTKVIEGLYAALKRYDIPDYLVWDGLYKRSAILDNNIRFHTDLSLHEDDVFMGELYCHVNKIVITDLPLYRYIRASEQSSTHNQSVEKQRWMIESSLMAIRYRGKYVASYCPEAMHLERLKYMRWVCQPKTAKEAGYMLDDYKALLEKYKELGCWPMDYRWMHVARLNWSAKVRMKNRIRTFLCNHPRFAYSRLLHRVV